MMFYYQNRTTGAPSSNPLSMIQLCRILCPNIQTNTNTNTTSSSDAKNTCLIQADTLLLGYDPVQNQYSPKGWQAAKSLSVLREACATWYYEGLNGKVMGPVSARVLSHRVFQEEEEGDEKLSLDTRVWSADILSDTANNDTTEKNNQSEWKRIGDLSHLQMALQYFYEEQPPALSSNNLHNNHNKNNNDKSSPDDMKHSEHDTSPMEEEALRELEAFLNVNTKHGKGNQRIRNENDSDNDSDDDQEGFESDGGTYYVKDKITEDWKPSKKRPLSPTSSSYSDGKSQQSSQNNTNSNNNNLINKKKRKKKAKFAAKNAKSWIYVTGLPKDTNEDEIAKYFSKVGILQLDPETQRPKVKLYRDKKSHEIKGDASICYARAESVDLALQILDESMFRIETDKISVTRAKFAQHGDTFDNTRKTTSISHAKRKVARLAALQAVGWDEGENGRITGGLKGLRIIVLKGMFSILNSDVSLSDEQLQELEQKIHSRCEEFGNVEKITIFSKNKDGVVIVKFTQPNAASNAVQALDSTVWNNEPRPIIATFWDGVTNYTAVKTEKEEQMEQQQQEKRHEEFGKWLESQELPEEFRLQVEGGNPNQNMWFLGKQKQSPNENSLIPIRLTM